MFVFFTLLAGICIAVSLLIGCQFIKHRYVRGIVSVLTVLIIVSSSVVLAIDFTSCLNGGVKVTEKITLSQKKITKSLDCYTINNRYWSVGGNFQEYEMLSAIKPKNMEIKTVKLDTLIKEHEFIIYYLPITKFIVKMEVPMIDGDSEVSNYEFMESGYYMYENKLISYVAVLSFVIMLLMIVVSIRKKMMQKQELVKTTY